MIGGKYGPQTKHVKWFLRRLKRLTQDEIRALERAYDNSNQVWANFEVERIHLEVDSERHVAIEYAEDESGIVMCDVIDAVFPDDRGITNWNNVAVTLVQNAVCGLVARDLINPETYRLLTDPVANVVGILHTDDYGFEEWLKG